MAPAHSSQRAVGILKRLTASADWLLCRVCITLFMAILCIMVLQISFRYIFSAPLTWTEELARYLYIWACWLGAPVAMRRGNHVVINVLSERFPRRLAQVASLSTQAIALFFLLELAYQGTLLTIRSHTVNAITLPIPWSMIYVAAPLSAMLMILETAETIGRTVGWVEREVQS
ncbi:MAG: TRAP transporter small permease [Thermodesulfobacteriota bacterium]